MRLEMSAAGFQRATGRMNLIFNCHTHEKPPHREEKQMNTAISFSIMIAMRSTGLILRELKPDIIGRIVKYDRI